MAPVRRKRAAPTAAGASPKKPHVNKELEVRHQRCAAVAAVASRAQLPPSVLAMFGSEKLIRECFALPKEERHKFQAEAVDMLSEIFEGLEAGLRAKVSELEARVAGAGADKEAREAAVTIVTEAVEAKKVAEQEAHAAAAAAVDAALASRDALIAAQTAQRSGDAELDVAVDRKRRLEACKTGIYQSLKDGTVETDKVKEGIEALTTLWGEFDQDPTLMHSLPSALEKVPSTRGTFDYLVLKQLEGEFEKHIASLENTIADGASGKAARASATAAAEQELEVAEKAQDSKKAEKAAAVAEKQEAMASLAAAIKAVNSWAAEAKHITQALSQANTAVDEFLAGPLTDFKELEAWSTPAPPESEKLEKLEACDVADKKIESGIEGLRGAGAGGA